MVGKIKIGELSGGSLPEVEIELPPGTNSYDYKTAVEGVYEALFKKMRELEERRREFFSEDV